jgi:hypothetical protein
VVLFENNATRRLSYLYLVETKQERNVKERKTKNERTIHAKETNEQRKRYAVSVSLNDPGSVLEHSLLVPINNS